MTESLWELAIVLLVSSAIFWLVWHFAAQLLSWDAGSCIEMQSLPDDQRDAR